MQTYQQIKASHLGNGASLRYRTPLFITQQMHMPRASWEGTHGPVRACMRANEAGVHENVGTSTHVCCVIVSIVGLSASRGFFGCKHFSKCNNFLKKDGLEPINWQV
jgi:hypothetical protein